MFRKINGAMYRNAQDIHPVSRVFEVITGPRNDLRTRVMSKYEFSFRIIFSLCS